MKEPSGPEVYEVYVQAVSPKSFLIRHVISLREHMPYAPAPEYVSEAHYTGAWNISKQVEDGHQVGRIRSEDSGDEFLQLTWFFGGSTDVTGQFTG